MCLGSQVYEYCILNMEHHETPGEKISLCQILPLYMNYVWKGMLWLVSSCLPKTSVGHRVGAFQGWLDSVCDGGTKGLWLLN